MVMNVELIIKRVGTFPYFLLQSVNNYEESKKTCMPI